MSDFASYLQVELDRAKSTIEVLKTQLNQERELHLRADLRVKELSTELSTPIFDGMNSDIRIAYLTSQLRIGDRFCRVVTALDSIQLQSIYHPGELFMGEVGRHGKALYKDCQKRGLIP
jgi:hypothetical protein